MKKIISAIMVLVILFTLTIPAFASEYVYYPTYTGNSHSIVDGLNAVGEDSSFANRKVIAERNGIKNYRGSAEDNLYLLDLLKQGRLIKSITHDNNQTSSAPFGEKNVYYPAYTGKSHSIVEGLNAIGVDSSFSNRKVIAERNGLKNYCGSAEDNLHLLNLLKQGLLIKEVQADYSSVLNKNPYVCYTYQQCTVNNNTTYEITKNNAPLREKPYSTGEIISRLSTGQLLSVVEVVRNSKKNNWLRIEYIGENGKVKSAYMYTGNSRIHEHVYSNVMNNENGTLKICGKCAHAIVTVGGKSVEQHLVSALSQSALGDYSKEETTFWGLVGRVLVGEIPGVGVIADVRDLVYDLTHDSHIGIIALDVLAVIPVVSALKHADSLHALKYANDLGNVGELAVKFGKYNLSDDVLELFMLGKGVNGKNVSGAHNMQHFLQTISDNGGDLSKCIGTKTPHSSIDGIYNIEYKTLETKNWAKSAKTVYDPSVIPDSQMFIWASEALSSAKPVAGTADMIEGWASNGLRFEAKIDTAGNIVHFYPTID